MCRFQRRSSTSTPAAILGLQFLRRRRAGREIRAVARWRPRRRRTADRSSAWSRKFVDHGAVGGDGLDFAVLLPERGGRALDDLDDDLAGIELAHARLPDQRRLLESRARRVDVEERQRDFRRDAGDGEHLAARQARLAGHRDRLDAETRGRARGSRRRPPSLATNAWYCPPRTAPTAATAISSAAASTTPRPRGAGRSKRMRRQKRAAPRALAAQQHARRRAASAPPPLASAGAAGRRQPRCSLSDRKTRPPPSTPPARQT